MLQINSGKLYQTGVGRKNQLRGVLYTNLVLSSMDDKPIETLAGTLRETGMFGSPNALVYELVEQIEDGRIASGVVVSHTAEPYLHDFAAVVSFALNVTCTPNHDLSARLLSGKRTMAVRTPASKLVKRVFDERVWCQPADATLLTTFVKDLIGLRRKSFLAVMNAIRTYVTGLQSVSDDPELAYTLLVAAIESLAQDFDGHEGQWSDLDDSKRRRLDEALRHADADTAGRVRQTLVEIEHLALSRRFREFALTYIAPGYYRDLTDRAGVVGKLDMRDGLKEAYRLRSRYMHNLRKLPDLLSSDMNYSEIVRSDHTTYLTLHGLARVVRHIIMQFVAREEKVDREAHDYSLERHGIVRGEWAPQYWIGRPEALGADSGRKFLEAFLQQSAAHLQSGSAVTDLSALLPKIEEMLPGLTVKQRKPLIALYYLYNKFAPAENRSPQFLETVRRFESDLAARSVEALVTYALSDCSCGWTLAEQRKLVDRYFEQRNGERGFRAPALFEAAFVLGLAERYRASGEVSAAQEVLTFAADNFPHFVVIQQREASFDAETPIDWGAMLLPSRPKAPDQPA